MAGPEEALLAKPAALLVRPAAAEPVTVASSAPAAVWEEARTVAKRAARKVSRAARPRAAVAAEPAIPGWLARPRTVVARAAVSSLDSRSRSVARRTAQLDGGRPGHRFTERPDGDGGDPRVPHRRGRHAPSLRDVEHLTRLGPQIACALAITGSRRG